MVDKLHSKGVPCMDHMPLGYPSCTIASCMWAWHTYQEKLAKTAKKPETEVK